MDDYAHIIAYNIANRGRLLQQLAVGGPGDANNAAGNSYRP